MDISVIKYVSMEWNLNFVHERRQKGDLFGKRAAPRKVYTAGA